MLAKTNLDTPVTLSHVRPAGRGHFSGQVTYVRGPRVLIASTLPTRDRNEAARRAATLDTLLRNQA